MSELSDKERQRVEDLRVKGVLGTVESWVKRLTAPFYWYSSERPRGNSVLYTGSMSFVHTGHRLLGVSACHVHDECLAAQTSSAQVTCQVGGITFEPGKRLIDRSKRLDIVTYDMSDILIAGIDADVHYAPAWPPRIVPGVFVVGGWLNALRREEEASTTHSFLHIIARCEHVTEENIGVVTYTSTSHPWGPKGLPSGTQLGGMSGGAVYLVEEDPLTKIFLVGTIYEYQPGLEIMLARPFTLINPDGSIRD